MENRVLIVMGSRSDLDQMKGCMDQLAAFEIPFEVRVLSAHRSMDAVVELSANARKNGFQVIIAAAGGAAHLAGAIASQTILPVIGIPIQTSALGGMDSLLSTVQMPGGIPVATMAIGKAGAKNAAILAAEIMALSDKELASILADFKKEQRKAVLESSYLEDYE